VKVGEHLIIDLKVNDEKKTQKEFLKKFIEDFKKKFKKEIDFREEIFYTFPNDTATYIAVLAESHFALHSYRENSTISIDVYFCKTDKRRFMEMEKFVIEYFNPIEINRKIFVRGTEHFADNPQNREKDRSYTFVKKLNDISRACKITVNSSSDMFLVPFEPGSFISYDPVTLKIERNKNE
jgi:S-adenosylmethionine/arginine decarboxylase-like enzyme